jgi:hypothetical protein
MSTRRLKIIIDQAGNGAAGIKSLAGGLGGLATIAGAAAVGATVAIGAIGTKLVSMGSDAEEMLGKFNVVFGQFSVGVTEELGKFAAQVGRSKFALMEMASGLQDTFVPMGFAREEAAAMSVEMSKLAVDVASFNNVTDEEVIRDFQSALVGNTETVRKYGIVINQARIEAKAAEMGLLGTTVNTEKVTAAQNKLAIAQQKLTELRGKDNVTSSQMMSAQERLRKAEEALATATAGSTGELTEQAKVLAIQQLIMEGTTDAQGDAARTSNSWANQMRRLKSIITDTATEMGLKLLPVVTPFLTQLGDFAQKMMPIVVEKFTLFAEGALPKLTDLLTRLWNEVLPEVIEKFKQVRQGITDVSDWVTGKAIPAIREFNENTIKPLIQSVKDWIAEFKERLDPVLVRINEMVEERLQPALKEFKVSWDRIAEALGIAKEEGEKTGEGFDTIGAILWTVEAAVKAVVWAVEAASNVFSVLSGAIAGVSSALDSLSRWWAHMRAEAQKAIDTIPPWLRPRSATPFEVGLRGIGDAMKDLDFGAVANVSPGVAMAGGGTPVVVNLTYSPVVSLGDRYEAEAQLAPFIAEGLRKAGVTVG